MGWTMLIWVAVIVGVPTVLWFLLSEREPANRDFDRQGDGHHLERP